MSLAAAFGSRVWPIEPTGPSRSPAGYITPATILEDNSPPIDTAALEALRGRFIEVVIRSIVLSIRNFLGIDLPSEQLGKFFENLITFLANIDFFDDSFPLAGNAITFIQDILDPTRKIFSINQLLLAFDNGGFPYGLDPGDWNDGVVFSDGTTIKRLGRNLSRLLDLNLHDPGFGLEVDLSDAVQAILERFDIQNTIDYILNAANHLGTIVSTTNPVSTVVDSVLSIVHSALQANKGLSAAEQRIAALEAAVATGPSTIISDDFNRAAASTMSAAADPWTVTYTGGGAGTIGLDGDGNAYWVEVGTGSRVGIARFDDDELDEDNGVLTVIIADAGDQAIVTSAPYLYLCCRMHASADTYVRVRLHNAILGNAQLQVVNAGVVTDIGSPGDVFMTSGVRYDFYFGTVAEPRNFVLKRNGATVFDIEDTGDVSQVGALYRHVGFGMTAEGWVLGQNTPSRLAVFTSQET